MALAPELDLPTLAYFDPDLRGPRFHEVMRALGEQGWLARHELGFVVLDREASDFFLRSRSTTFPGQMVAEVFGVSDGPLREEIDRNILHINGADHQRLRGLVNPAFTPKAAQQWRPFMRSFIEELFEPVEKAGACEAVEQLCKPYPALTIATVMGAPLADAGRLAEWSNWIQRQFAADFQDHRERIEQACAELYEYLGALLEERRAAPGDDLISTLIAARGGEGAAAPGGERKARDGREDRLTDDELVNLVLNVLVGGVDTTQSQLAQALRLFAEHPDQWELLRGDLSLVPAAVDETIRYEPITPFTARICLEELEFRGVTFPMNSVVMVSAFNANHEGHSDEFDITREGGKTWTFGAGIHYCLGANLAKAELQEALTFLAPRMPRLRLDGEPAFESVQGIYGLASLLLRWG